MTADSAACLFRVLPPETKSRPDPVMALTAALTRGDEAAFRDFHEAYAGRLLRYALAVTQGDATLAEEAVQLALVRVATKMKGFSDGEVFWAWLATVTRSCIVDSARQHARYAASQ